jgi:hypothetical protein
MRSRTTISCFLVLLFLNSNISCVNPLSFKLNFTESNHDGSAVIQFQEDAFYNKAVRLTKEELNGQIAYSIG